MFEKIVNDFSRLVFEKYYEIDYLENVTKEDWKVEFPHRSSALFGFNPETNGKELLHDEQENVLFRFIWNAFDRILYVKLERAHYSDREIFSSIYEDLITFLKEREFDCLVTVFGLEDGITIPAMLNDIPFSVTGPKSEHIYSLLSLFPTFLEGVPVLQIGFDGIQFNDRDSKYFKFMINYTNSSITMHAPSGESVAILTSEEESSMFIEKYL